MKWLYEIYIGKRKIKNNFEKFIYKIFLVCGVSPSKLLYYRLEKGMDPFIRKEENNEKDNSISH